MTMYKIKQFALAPATLILGVGRSCMCPSLQWSRLGEAGFQQAWFIWWGNPISLTYQIEHTSGFYIVGFLLRWLHNCRIITVAWLRGDKIVYICVIRTGLFESLSIMGSIEICGGIYQTCRNGVPLSRSMLPCPSRHSNKN
jgi:hypothetical protein